MYVKTERPIDQYLTLMALLPFTRDLPPLAVASKEQIDELNILWSAALMRPDEIERPPFVFKSGGDDSETAKLRYELFLIIRNCLAAITEAVAGERPQGNGVSRVLPSYEMPATPALEKRWITLSGRGIGVFNEPQQIFLNCLEATGEDIWNLRACPICDVPFLPRREDQKACTLKCSNVFRLRKHRVAKMKNKKQAVRSGRGKEAVR